MTSLAYEGSHSIRCLVLEGAPPIDGHTGRATLAVSSGAVVNGQAVLPYDTDRWFGFAVYVPANPDMVSVNVFNTHTHNWGSVECEVSNASSPISFRVRGPSFPWPMEGADYHWALLTYPAGTNGAEPGKELVFRVSADSDIDHWTTFVFHINLSYSDPGPGLLEIWKNGVLIHADYDFTLADYPVPESCGEFYPKIGASTAGTAGYPLEAFHDAIRWGDENSSQQEVDPIQDVQTNPDGGSTEPDGGTGKDASARADAGDGGAGHSDASGTDARSGDGSTMDGGAADSSDQRCGCKTGEGGTTPPLFLLASLFVLWRSRRRKESKRQAA